MPRKNTPFTLRVFDQFDSYEARGDAFRQIVMEMPKRDKGGRAGKRTAGAGCGRVS